MFPIRLRPVCSVPAVLLALLLAVPRVAVAHPKPGAHADIRITVTPTEVRLDLIMNLMFVDGLVQTARQRPDAVEPDEEERVRLALRQYFGATSADIGGVSFSPASASYLLDRPNRLSIDDLPVAPLERSFAIVQPELEDRPGFEQNPLLLIPQVHLSLQYPCKAAARRVELVWGTFPLDFLAQDRDTPPPTQVEAILVAPGGVQEIVLTTQDPAFTWHNPGAPPRVALPQPRTPSRAGGIPVASIGVMTAWVGTSLVLAVRAGRARRWPIASLVPALAAAWLLLPFARFSLEPRVVAPPQDEGREIFRALHANIYRAFDYTTESEIYDALAQSVDGSLLADLYTQVYTSLIMFEEGGAVSRVKSLTPVSDSVEPADGPTPGLFRVRARWRVEGVVYHWGHSHTRLNEYAALYDVGPTDLGWRIVGVTPLEQFRLDPAGAQAPGAPDAPPAPTSWHPNR